MEQQTLDIENETMLSKFHVCQEKFDGPFGLLLHLIDEKELNIGEISINGIISKYIDFIKTFEKFDIAMASEFLVMAAYLVELKSRLLLPIEELPGEMEDQEDLESSLLEHLQAYKIFKDAAVVLRERKNIFSKIFSRYQLGLSNQELPRDIFLVDISVRDLVVAFQKIWDRLDDDLTKDIMDEPVTVKEKIEDILNRIKAETTGVRFESLFTKKSRIEVIVTFLAVLELICRKAIKYVQEENFGSIVLFSAQEGSIIRS